MRLFMKHLLRTAAKRPLQPILLVMTLMLAVMTSVFTLKLNQAIDEENACVQSVSYGKADLTVSLDGASSSRFMFARDVEELLGDGVAVAGCLELPLSVGDGEESVGGVAVDFSKIEKIFDFKFIEYGSLTASGVSSAAFVTRSFAEENSLSVGDSFTAKAFGAQRGYTVVGISQAPLISSYEIIVDISSVVRIIAGDSLLLSSMKDGFRPCSTIYIDVIDGSVEEYAEMLSASPLFAGNTVTDVSNAVDEATDINSFSLIIDVSIILACILAATAAFCCLYILSFERTEENRSFMLSGMRARELHAMQYLEVLVYWLIGAAGGILLTLPLVRMFWRAVGFRFADASLGVWEILLGSAIILAVAMLTVLVFTSSERMKKPARKNKTPIAVSLIPLVITVCLLAFIFTLSVDARIKLYVPFIIMLSLTVFLYAAPILRALVKSVDRLLDKRGRKYANSRFVSLHYAVKNILSVRILHNTARLCALLIMTVANVAMVIMSVLGYMKFVKQSVTPEYAVLGATESCYQKVCSSELVRDCYKFYMQNATVEGRNGFMLIGVSDMAAISDDIRPQSAPSGNLAAVSRGVAHEYSLEVGDTLSFEVSNQAVTLVVGEILDVGPGCVLLDNESLGLHYNMLAVNGKDGVSEAELFNELSKKTSTELATMMSMEEVWEQKMEHMNVYLVSGVFLLIIVVVFALIGIINNLGQSYRARRDDFRLYRLSGMSAAGVRRMKCAEILLTIGFSLVLAAAGSALFLATTNYAMRANAYEIIMHIKSFFRFS